MRVSPVESVLVFWSVRGRTYTATIVSLKLQRWILAAVVLVAFVAYLPSLGNEFAMDDRFIAKARLDDGRTNEMVAELRPLGEYFTSNYWKVSGPDPLFRPVTVLSYALVHGWFVPDGASDAREAFPQHLVNVLLHLACVLLVFSMIRRVTRVPIAALAGALVFALHPVHVESVAGVVGRAEILSMAFGAGALLVLWNERGGSSAGRGVAAAVLLFLAFCSKESALAWLPFVPVFALARHAVTGGEGSTAAVLKRAARRALIAGGPPLLLFLLLRHGAVGTLEGIPRPDPIANPLAWVPFGERLVTAIRVWGYGLLLCVFPFELSADYGPAVFGQGPHAADAGFAVSLAALLLVLAVSLWSARRRPLVFLAGTTFLGFSFLTSNVPLAIGTILGERLYYVPSLGVSFAAAWLAGCCPERRPWLVGVLAVTGLWCAVSAVTVFTRAPVFKDDATLFQHEVENQPRSARMRASAASVLKARGDLQSSIRHLEEAVRLVPSYARGWNNLAADYLDARRLADAEHAARRGLDATLPGQGGKEQLYCNLGIVYAMRSDLGRSVEAFGSALESDEAFVLSRLRDLPGTARLALADRLLAQGRREVALRLLDALAGEEGVMSAVRERAASLARRLRGG